MDGSSPQASAPSIAREAGTPHDASDEGSLHGVPEVLGPDRLPGRVADPFAQREPVGQPVGGDLGERRRQVRDERGAVGPPTFLYARSPSFVIERICQTNVSLRGQRGPDEAGASVSGEETVRVPPRCSVADAPTASHRPSPSVARDTAAPPTGTVCSTVFVARVDRGDRVVELVRDPQRARRSPERVRALTDGIVASTRPVEGSRRDTVPSRRFATQIEPNAATTAVGPLPTVFVSVTLRPAGSTRTSPRERPRPRRPPA